MTEEITDVADFMISLLGADCSGEDELTYLTLRVFLFPFFLTQTVSLNGNACISLLLSVERKMFIIFVFIDDRLLETWVQ